MFVLNLLLTSTLLGFSVMAVQGLLAGDATGVVGLYMAFSTLFVIVMAQIVSRESNVSNNIEKPQVRNENEATVSLRRVG